VAHLRLALVPAAGPISRLRRTQVLRTVTAALIARLLRHAGLSHTFDNSFAAIQPRLSARSENAAKIQGDLEPFRIDVFNLSERTAGLTGR